MIASNRVLQSGIQVLAAAFALALVIGILFFRTQPGLSDDAKARLLAGAPVADQEVAAAKIGASAEWKRAAAQDSVAHLMNLGTIETQYFGSVPNLLVTKRIQSAHEFLTSAIPGPFKNTVNVLYPFSGPDFSYPNLFFPHMQELLLVGLESVGDLPDVEALNQKKQLSEVMHKLAEAFRFLPSQSYFETQIMAVTLKQFGVCPLLAVGLVAGGNQIVRIEKFRIGKTQGVEIHYLRGDGLPASLTYLQQDLSDFGLAQSPEFEQFLRAKNFDTLYLKAAQYLLFHENFSRFTRLALASAHYVVQSDDGLPLREFTGHPGVWRIKMFGFYARPNAKIVGNRFQQDFFDADAAFICQSGESEMIRDFQRIWSDEKVCDRFTGKAPPTGLAWGGFIPFPYGYGYRISETPPDLRAVTSNLIFAERR